MTDIAALRGDLMAALDAAHPDQALVTLSDLANRIAPIDSGQTPHPVIGLAAMLISMALLRSGRQGEVAEFVLTCSDALAPPNRKGEGDWRLVAPFHFLHAPLIDAALLMRNQAQAVTWLNRAMKDRTAAKEAYEDDAGRLLAHSASAAYGPFHVTAEWMLPRYARTSALGPLDHRLDEVQRFHAGYAQCALLAERPEEAMPLIEAELEWYLASPGLGDSHFEFNAICVLAALGRFDQALNYAARLVRRGYQLAWRFSLESARKMQWTQNMRQNEWLAALAETSAYRFFLETYLPGPLLGDGPEDTPLCLVRDGAWSGKKNKRCALSREPIKPGEPVVRFRRLFNRAPDGSLEIASSKAFAASPWQAAREAFESDSISLAQLFPRLPTCDAKLNDAPGVHAFVFDLARDIRSFDLGRAVAVIADHAQPPIAYSWQKPDGSDRWQPALPVFAGADGHGDAVNFAWRLIKAGVRQELIGQVAALPVERADKVFAMLATFDDSGLRQAAARHFDLPDLPEMMATVFKDRLSTEDLDTLAVFGATNDRYRAGLVAAMHAYGLHLYSNYRPKPDWFLDGLGQYVNAGGAALLYFLIDRPEDDNVLHTVIEKRWLPDRCAGFDEHYNIRPFYVRATLFHLFRNRPEELSVWLTEGEVHRWQDMAYDRETLRLIRRRIDAQR